MKKIFLAALVLSLAGNVFGDSAAIIKAKAKSIANQNNAQQGRPPQAPASKPAKPATPTSPQLPAEQQIVVNDLTVVRLSDTNKFAADLMALAQGPNKPSVATIQKLAKDLVTGLGEKTLNVTQRTRITQDIQAVMNGSSGVSAAQMEAIIVDVPTLLKMAGVDSTFTAAIGDDLRAVRAQVLHSTTPPTAP